MENKTEEKMLWADIVDEEENNKIYSNGRRDSSKISKNKTGEVKGDETKKTGIKKT